MRTLGPDDYTVGRLVTIMHGPFTPIHSPFPMGMFEQDAEPQIHEDISLHGRVFKIVVFDAPWVVLEPLDGIGDTPEIRNLGPFTMLPHGGKWAPQAVKLNVKGVQLGEVSAEYVAAYQKHFCPPAHLMHATQQAPQPPMPEGGPIQRLLADIEGGCDTSGDGSCPVCGGPPHS